MSHSDWDDLRGAALGNLQLSPEEEAKWRKYDNLMHKVFKQNEDGVELLAFWKEALIMSPTAQEGMDSVAIGINEGRKSFIRDIILTTERVDKDE